MTDREIGVIRTPHNSERPYFLMARSTAQDEKLSWAARGVIAYLLSKPDNWQIMVSDLQQLCGRDKVRAILNELKEAHYLEVTQAHDDNGRFLRNEYTVHEIPFTEKPSTDEPSTGNPPLHNTEKRKNTEKKSGRQRDPIFEAIGKVWNTEAGGYIGSMKSMFVASETAKGEWKRCAIQPPVTDAQEILDFEPKMREWMQEKKMTTPPTAAVTIQRWFLDYRRLAAEGNVNASKFTSPEDKV